jgi:hypothetical protein
MVELSTSGRRVVLFMNVAGCTSADLVTQLWHQIDATIDLE